MRGDSELFCRWVGCEGFSILLGEVSINDEFYLGFFYFKY